MNTAACQVGSDDILKTNNRNKIIIVYKHDSAMLQITDRLFTWYVEVTVTCHSIVSNRSCIPFIGEMVAVACGAFHFCQEGLLGSPFGGGFRVVMLEDRRKACMDSNRRHGMEV